MKSYIEEGGWASCTFDLLGVPRQVQREAACDRMVVGYPGKHRLLTIDDRVIEKKFSCKSPAKFWGGLLALAGGIVVGAVALFSGPVGWVLLGAVVVTAVGTTVAVCAHSCTDPLKAGEWTNAHPHTKIMRSSAVLYLHSQLNCKAGGILIVSETFDGASDLSGKMATNALVEVGVQILSNGLVGYLSVAGLKSDVAVAGIAGIMGHAMDGIKGALRWGSLPVLKVLLSPGLAVGGYNSSTGTSVLLTAIGAFGSKFSWQGQWRGLVGLGIGIVADRYEDYLEKSNEAIEADSLRRAGASEKTIVAARF